FRTDGYNNGKFSNADYDKLLNDAKTAADPAPIYKAAEELLIKEMALVPVYHYAKPMMVKADLRGWPKANVMNDWYAKDMYRVAE
nr:oligopeptide ABC transporter substrate-binding protein OppA [Paracoccus sp. (in: a-proteobacteria)]